MTAQDRGRFVWHELNTTDVPAAERFYRAVTGWGIRPFELNPSYRMWTSHNVPQGGVMVLPDAAKQMGAPPLWLSYISVPDMDATVRQATQLGGRTYLPPQDIPGGGQFAVLADPQGAAFAVHTSALSIVEPEAAPKVGEFSWHELVTTDWQAAWKFYEALFGWVKMDAMDMGPMGTYQMFGRGAFMYGGMYNKPKEMPAPAHWLPYAMVASVDRALAKVTGGGGKILNGPMDVPGGDRVVMCMDPQGVAFALHSKAAVAAKVAAAPAATPKAQPAAKLAATPKATATAQPKATATAQPKAKAAAKPKAKAAAKPKAKGAVKAKTTSKAKAKAKPKTKAQPKRKAAAKSNARTKAKAKAKPKAKAQPKRKAAAKAKSKARPNVKSKAKPKAKARMKPKAKAKPKARSKSKPKAKSRPKRRAR